MPKNHFRLAILFFLLLNSRGVWAQVLNDYRSIATGNWATIGTWETYNGATWVAAATAPVTGSNVITIRSPHVVTIAAAVAGGIDQVIVDAGATLNTSGAIAQVIAAGVGVDLQINGTFGDLSTGSISFAVGATWQIGATGTLIKTTGSSSNNWQNAYQGGIATIPATANWILRKIGAQQPALSTTTPASGSVYPNLFIENNTGTAWVTPLGSSFTGTTARATIKGNLDIGGAGTNTVDFLTSNTFASCILVQGNVVIRPGNSFRNYGTGIEIQGNLTVNGTLVYDANDARRLIFSGANAQSVSGSGSVNVYDMTLNKTGGAVTLNRPVTVDNLSTFTSGILITSSTNLLIIGSAGSVAGANNTSFASGPVRYLGSSAFTFPVGKVASYRPLSISALVGGGSFWFENFNNGCSAACPGAGYTGINGPWTQTITGAEGLDPNTWFVSCAENGYTGGNCGTGCVPASAVATLATLHISAAIGNPFCPGDCGAAYDAGGLCGLLTCPLTDKRIESPTINCTGYSSIQLSFNYIENGATTLDNATCWYFDGATWSQLVDMPKTGLCGAQGLWTAYSIALPPSANNNPSVKIGFRWVNNDDGAGTDPSFAVDNVSLGTADYFTAEYFPANPQIVYNNVLAPTLTSISSCEYWILDRAPTSSASTNVTLSWDAASCNVTVLADLRVARFDGAVWQNHGNGGTTGTATAGTVITAAAVTTFSPFTLANNTAPLPIELISFDAHYNGKETELYWATATELNNDYFTVECSHNGQEFVEILRQPGAGTSLNAHTYTGFDYHPVNGVNYYRLKQTDFNGQYSYSQIVPVNISNAVQSTFGIVQALPSEESLNLLISLGNSANLSVEVFDMQGRRLSYQTTTATGTQSSISLSTAGWAAGFYLVKVSDGEKVETRLVKL
jgi:Secretion system C-terminal sorting domain